MKSLLLRAGLPALAALWSAQAPAVDALDLNWFADLPAVSGVSLSPDGHYISYIGRQGDGPVVYIRDLTDPEGRSRLVVGNQNSDPMSINWCRWANTQRLLCSIQFSYTTLKRVNPRLPDTMKGSTFETRLVSVGLTGDIVEMGQKNTGDALLQDRIIDWTPNDPDSVLLALDDDMDGYPAVDKLNINTGEMTDIQLGSAPLTRYYTDGRGEIRLAQGKDSKFFYYFARLLGEEKWRAVAAFPLTGMRNALKPESVEPGTNRALAFGADDDRRALFEMDLKDVKNKPKLIASRPNRDILNALYSVDGRYIGYSYIDERMHYEYTDAKARKVIDIATKQLPKDISLRIADMTLDGNLYLLEATSDINAGSYYLLDMNQPKEPLRLVADARPEFDDLPMPRVKTISYKATDGTQIQGFLTLPLDVPATKLPMVVLPHAFNAGVDFQQFDYLRLFLASRGYAVLQMNFRGSWGYGQKWLSAGQSTNAATVAHGDIIDGARWAIAQGIADPNRLAIAGFEKGGYQALLAGYRDKDLFKAIISIGGISNLVDEKDAMDSTSEKLVGDKWLQMRRDSPIHHADEIAAPVLLIHGGLDMLADPYQSERMAIVLKGEKKTYTYLPIKTADNRFWKPSERAQILSAAEVFLQQHLSGGARSVEVVPPVAPSTTAPAPAGSAASPQP